MLSNAAPSPRILARLAAAAAAVAGILVLSLVPVPPTAAADPAPTVVSTVTTKASPDDTTALQGMAVSGFGETDVLQVTVSTDVGTLSVGETDGLELAFGNSWTGDSSVTFTGTTADVNAGLASVSLSVGEVAGEIADVALTAFVDVPGYVFSPANEHFYEYVADPGISWDDAHAAAQTRTMNGQSGYLATIPNDRVNDLVSSKIEGADNVWFGAVADQTPDQPVARTWTWSGGPLAGEIVSRCSNFVDVCDFVNNDTLYAHWADGEPNNAGASRTGWHDPICDMWWWWDGDFPSSCYDDSTPWEPSSGEWVAVTNWGGVTGRWNDLPPVNGWDVSGYVVEYGDEPVGSSSFTGVVTATSPVSIETVPGAPTDVSATRGDGSVTVSFTAATDNGSPLISSTVTASPGGATCSTEGTGCTLTGLTNGTEYAFTAVATNANGDGPASAPATATPSTVPGPPTTVTAQRGDRSATITFTAPTDDGGAEVTGYTVTTSPGEQQTECSSGPCVVADLVNGEEYTFTVTAENVAGSSLPSEPSAAVVPAGIPSAPGNVSATHGDGSATVTFDDSDDNGSPVQHYTVTSSPGAVTAQCPSSPCEVTGLANGTTYSFVVVATNEVGEGDVSAPSGEVTPATVPTAPGAVTVTRGDRSMDIEFAPPTSDGGAAITGYEYSLDGGETWLPLTTSGSSPLTATVADLENGTEYDVAVRALNPEGASAPSEPGLGTPAASPDAPTAVAATRGDGEATVAFSAPADNGSAITGYTATSAPGGLTASCPSSPCLVTGLDNGTAYTFSVVASNDVGDSDPSASSDAVTPATTPGAPRAVEALSQDGAVSLTFEAPLHDGGAPVTGYQVSLDEGDTWQPLTVSEGAGVLSAAVTGLTNGDPVTVRVRASNEVGSGDASDAATTVTPAGKPSAPRHMRVQVDGTSAVVSWSEPTDDGGSPITGYRVTAAPGEGSCVTVGATGCTVSGLVVGETYVFTTMATNLAEGRQGTGEGPGADTDSVTVRAEPGAATGLTARGGDRALRLSWRPPLAEGTSPVSGYQVSLDGGHTWRGVVTGNTTPVRAVVQPVLNGVTYEVAVRAVNDEGPGVASDVVEVTPARWFSDPLTRTERVGLIPVPRRPESYRGRARRTTADHTAHDGSPSMSAGSLHGRKMQPGQAVDFGWGPLFEFDRAVLSSRGRHQLKSMVTSLRWVRSVTCEGYADYGGVDGHAHQLSVKRAQVVCQALRSYGGPVETSARGYGNHVPVVVSKDRFPDRAPNRRVVVVING